MLKTLLFAASVAKLCASLTCESGYSCYKDDSTGIVWVKKDSGQTSGPDCSGTCSNALAGNAEPYSCPDGVAPPTSLTDFAPIAAGLGFTCRKGYCWSGGSGAGQIWVTKGDSTSKNCYMPDEDAMECPAVPGNANCYGERFSLVCPCTALVPTANPTKRPTPSPEVGVTTGPTLFEPICNDGYSCYSDNANDLVWVKLDAGNVNGPSCQNVCEGALNQNDDYYSCQRDVPTALINSNEKLMPIADSMGFVCKDTPGCFDNSWDGLAVVTLGDITSKSCLFPTADTLSCTNAIGNQNCFGERYSQICPCRTKALDEACVWDAPDNRPTTAVWGDYETGTSCLDRINYWRLRACDEGWVECPPAGLPPMTECTCCHECANSQAEYDTANGAHASFKRCGDMSQGEGGGSTCANVIDSFVSERTPDADGVWRCEGHCGPIVKAGCQTFFWGRAESSAKHTLNWRTCNPDTCQAYCDNPSDNACFKLDDSIAPDTCGCPGEQTC